MPPQDSGLLVMVVEDCFQLRDRGWALAPALAVDRFPPDTRLAIEVVEPDGAIRSLSGRFLIQHLRLAGGESRWQGVVLIDAVGAARPPAGSRITCRPA